MRDRLGAYASACAVLAGCTATGGAAPVAPPAATPLPREVIEARVDLSGRAYELPEALAASSAPAADAPSPSRRIGLAEALRMAQTQNLDLALARSREEIAGARARRARGRLFPELEGGASAAHRDGRVQGSFGDEQDVAFSTFEPSVALVYRRNVVSELLLASASVLEARAVELDGDKAEQELLLDVSQLYYSLVLAKVAFQIAKAIERDNQRLLSIVQARESAGLSSGSDAARAAARLAAASESVVDARAQRTQAAVRLATVLRLPPATPLDPLDGELAVTELAATSGWNATASAGGRPDVLAAGRRAQSADRAASGALWDLLAPRLVAELRQSWVGGQIDDLGGRTSYGVGFLWTISEEKLGLASEGRAVASMARIELERARERGAAEVFAAEQAARDAGQRIPPAAQRLEAAERAFRISLARFQDGTGAALDVFESQDDVARARLGLARGIALFNLAQLRLLAAAGILDASRLTAR